MSSESEESNISEEEKMSSDEEEAGMSSDEEEAGMSSDENEEMSNGAEEQQGDDSEDDSDAPESVSFGQSKQDALEKISLALKETRRLKDKEKEKRRTRHELHKKQKQRKIDLSSAKLPDSILEEISQLDQSQKTKPTETPSPRVGSRISEEDRDDDEKDEGISEGEDYQSDDGGDYIPLEGFKAVPMSEVKLKAPPSKETALEFLQKHMYGGRVNRESVDKHISRLNKKQHKPAFHFTKSGAQKKQKKGKRRRKRGKNWQSLLAE